MDIWKRATVAAAFVAVGLGAAGVASMVGATEAETAPPTAGAPESVTALEPVHGLIDADQAVAFWEARAADQPLDYLNRTQLGVALMTRAREQAELEDYESAESVLREALQANPSHLPAIQSLASAVHSQHRFDEAADLAEQVLAEDPDRLGSLAVLGDAHLELGDYDKAEAIYRELGSREPSAPVISRLARLASAQGDSDRALRLATDALELSDRLALRPNGQAFYWFQLGHFRFVAGDTDGAIAALERALQISPEHPGANEKLAFITASTGAHAAAVERYQRLIDAGAAPDLHGTLADLLRLVGDDDAAAEQDRLGIELARDVGDRFPAERRHLVEFWLTRDPGQALRLAELDFAERRDVLAYDTLAWALHHNARSAEAAPLIDEAVALGGRDARVLFHAAAIGAANGDLDSARDRLDRAMEINPYFHPTEAADAAMLAAELDR